MKVGGQILWNVTPICETSQIYYLMGRRPCERRFGQPSKGPIIPFGSLVEYLPITAKDQSRIHQFGKSYLDCPSDTLSTRGEFGRVTYWLQILRSWRRWTHQKSIQKKTQCERGDISQWKGEFIFPIADGRIKTPGGGQDLRTSTLVRHRPLQGESDIDFLGESEGSLPQSHDSLPDAGKAMNDFWSMSGNFKNRHHVEPRIKLYSPREESFPVLKHIDVSRKNCTNSFGCRSASMIIGMSMGLEPCQIFGQVSHKLLYWKKNLQKDMCGTGGD